MSGPATEALRAYLGGKVRVRIADGRLIEGELQCMDSGQNFILGEAVEYHGVEDEKESPIDTKVHISRFLGIASIPGKQVVKVFALSPQEVV